MQQWEPKDKDYSLTEITPIVIKVDLGGVGG